MFKLYFNELIKYFKLYDIRVSFLFHRHLVQARREEIYDAILLPLMTWTQIWVIFTVSLMLSTNWIQRPGSQSFASAVWTDWLCGLWGFKGDGRRSHRNITETAPSYRFFTSLLHIYHFHYIQLKDSPLRLSMCCWQHTPCGCSLYCCWWHIF